MEKNDLESREKSGEWGKCLESQGNRENVWKVRGKQQNGGNI